MTQPRYKIWDEIEDSPDWQEYIEQLKRERRKDLKKHYKKVCVCKGCGEKFGVDKPKAIMICPVCHLKIRRENEENDNS